MLIKDFKRYFPEATANNYARRLSNEQWSDLKPWLTQLHEQGQTRQQIAEAVQREHCLTVTQGQLNRKFKDWNLKVYNKHDATRSTTLYVTNPDLTTIDSTDSAIADCSVASDPDSNSVEATEQDTASIQGNSLHDELHELKSDQTEALGLPYFSDHPAHVSLEDITITPLQSPSPSLFDEDQQNHLLAISRRSSFISSSRASLSSDDGEISVLSYNEGEEQPCAVIDEIDGPAAALSLFDKLEHKPYQAALQAIIGLAAFYRSTRLFTHAYHIYKKLYQTFLASSPPDDVYRIGALINCARLVSGRDESIFVTMELSSTISWLDAHWNTEHRLSGQALHDYMSALRIALLRRPRVRAAAPSVSSEAFTVELKAFYSALKAVSPAAQEMFAHVAALNYEGDPASCSKLFENFSKYVRWGLVWTRVNAYSFESEFRECLVGTKDDRWRLVRSMVLHLISPASRKNLSTFQQSTLRCDCTFCPITLTGDDLGNVEESTALANTIVTQVLAFLKMPKPQEETEFLSYYGISPVQRAIDQALEKNFSSTSFNTTCHDLWVIQDFLASYRACFEASFVTKCKIPLSIPKDIALRVESTICKNAGLNIKEHKGIIDTNTSFSSKPPPSSGHWLTRLVTRTRSAGPVTYFESPSELKRNRSAVSSVLTAKFSRSSSLRSFEHLAKRIKQQSNGSHRSVTSTWSQTSSHPSLRFETVTNLMPLNDLPVHGTGPEVIIEGDEGDVVHEEGKKEQTHENGQSNDAASSDSHSSSSHSQMEIAVSSAELKSAFTSHPTSSADLEELERLKI